MIFAVHTPTDIRLHAEAPEAPRRQPGFPYAPPSQVHTQIYPTESPRWIEHHARINGHWSDADIEVFCLGGDMQVGSYTNVSYFPFKRAPIPQLLLTPGDRWDRDFEERFKKRVRVYHDQIASAVPYEQFLQLRYPPAGVLVVTARHRHVSQNPWSFVRLEEVARYHAFIEHMATLHVGKEGVRETIFRAFYRRTLGHSPAMEAIFSGFMRTYRLVSLDRKKLHGQDLSAQNKAYLTS